MDTVAEVWKPIPVHSGYEASNLGRIKSLDRVVQRERGGKIYEAIWKGRIMKQTPHKGYVVMKLGKLKKFFGVHQLIAMAFLGECPAELVVNHINGIKTDNRPENLEYISNRENVLHAYRTGLLSNHGETNGNVKLSHDDVEKIKSMFATHRNYEIAKLFGVSKTHITRIAKGRTRLVS